MAKTETTTFWNELAAANLYKRSQGRLTRQLTAGALGLGAILGAYSLSEALSRFHPAVRYGIPAVVVLVSAWLIFRLVNYSKFAEFLIAVEGEVHKVSWASRQELIRATIVVLTTMFSLAAILYSYDLVLLWFLRLCGVVHN